MCLDIFCVCLVNTAEPQRKMSIIKNPKVGPSAELGYCIKMFGVE